MDTTAGFYKQDGTEWFYAPNFVYNKTFELLKESKDQYNYPVDGWTWYDEAPQGFIDWKTEQENQL